jgi:hypothetical protein
MPSSAGLSKGRGQAVFSGFFLEGRVYIRYLGEAHPEGIVLTQPLQGGENIMGPSLSAWLGDLGTQFCL